MVQIVCAAPLDFFLNALKLALKSLARILQSFLKSSFQIELRASSLSKFIF